MKEAHDLPVNDLVISPVNTGIIIKFYDNNPYLNADMQTKSGLIVGIESSHKHKANQTGEMEEDLEVIACAEVIAVGKKCENVELMDDVFVNKQNCRPLPFKKQGYYLCVEQNVLARIHKKPQIEPGLNTCSKNFARDLPYGYPDK